MKAILTNKKLTERQQEYRFFKPWLGESIFTTSLGVWKTKRKEFYSYFNSKTVENSIGVFEHHSNNFINALEKHAVSTEEFDIHKSVESFAMDVICEVALGMRNNSHVKITKMQHFIEEFVSFHIERMKFMLYLCFFFSDVSRY